MKINLETPLCVCGKRMFRYGLSSSGKQRFRCSSCKTTRSVEPIEQLNRILNDIYAQITRLDARLQDVEVLLDKKPDTTKYRIF